MSQSPDVSVIIPAYNAERFIEDTLRSIQSQTLENWEVLVADDGSTDLTAEIVERICKEDSRFRLLRGSHLGVSAGRNRALAQARAPYVAFLDADDLWIPQTLEKQLETIRREKVDIVICDPDYCDEWGHPLQTNRVVPIKGRITGRAMFSSLFPYCHLLVCAILGRTSVFQKVGGFDEQLTACEDWDLWLRVAREGHTFYATPEKLCTYRIHSDGLSSKLDYIYRNDGVVLDRYSIHPWVSEAKRRVAYRLRFRNRFTYLVDSGRFEELDQIFQEYERQDSSGYSCRLIRLLQAFLPLRLFGLVSRYLVIPLSWHLERLKEHWEKNMGRER